jgi:hypothetical protein
MNCSDAAFPRLPMRFAARDFARIRRGRGASVVA